MTSAISDASSPRALAADRAARRAPPMGGLNTTLLRIELMGVLRNRCTMIFPLVMPAVFCFGRPGFLRRALVAGANGFVVKDTPARELADAVRRVHTGLRVVDPVLAADSLAVGDSPLTTRETEVLRAAKNGGSVSDIASTVFLSEGTVRNHLSAAIGKTDARNRADAVRVAEEHGWL